jgi:uncharacterized protein (DUF1697 family)
MTLLDTRVALLRGINVGRAKRVAMAELRAMVESLDYGAVRTLLNSGNVVFTVPGRAKGDPATRIEKALESELGVSSKITVLTAAELATVVAENPLLEVADNPSRTFVAFLADPARRKQLEPLARQDWTPELLAVGARVAYLWCPDGLLASRLSEAVGKLLGDGVTTRNWATVVKLQALIEARTSETR